jgi:hypothetical protein
VSIAFVNSANQEKSSYLGPLYTNSSVNLNLKECIGCPDLCVNCIKNLCDITNANIEEDKYNVVYVSRGKVTLFFPCTKTEKQLDTNQLMLIPNETKFIMKSGNLFSASCVVTYLDGEQETAACPNRANSNCVYGKSH